MNDIKNDKNLREAVSRREQQLPPIPDDLNERVMKSLVEPETASKSRRLWVYAAVAAAASIALLIFFNWDKQQNPQEPVVAQKSPRHEVSPASATIVQPEVVPDEQPKEKPVSALSEDAPQRAEPASTEDVSPHQSPLEEEAPPLWEGAGGEAEPFFIASTSYMVTHRNYRGSLATSESEEGSAIQLSTKTVSQNRPPIPQIPHRKLTKKEREQATVLGAIATKRWHIDITSTNTLRYGSRSVTSDFYLELRGDTLRSYLPYLGDAHMPTMSPSIGLNFEEPVLTYKESKPKKYTQIDIDVRTREDSYHYVIEIYDNGQAYIRVRSMNRDPISFDGTLEIE
ncbi:MAG: DUF4251 domain-containing protein [Prevotella sp.]|nr:DUF4251 domain-containing protein [Prevotella sp.]